MLKSNLVRARAYKGTLRLSTIDPEKKQISTLAEALITCFEEHVGRSLGELKTSLAEIEGDSPRFRLIRGLADLLRRRIETEISAPVEPSLLREEVFRAAALAREAASKESWSSRRLAILEEIAVRHGVSSTAIEAGLHADLEDRQRVSAFKEMRPTDLVHRYNLALAQSALLKASTLVVEITTEGDRAGASYRQLFQYLKFYQLLHEVEVLKEGGYRLVVDGPLSVMAQTKKYGRELARFLPALLLCEGWKAKAHLLWGKESKPLVLELSSEDGLVSHYRSRGVYLTETQEIFLKRFRARKTPWEIETSDLLVPLGGQGIWVPDFRFVHPDGRVAYLEVLGYWRVDYLKRRLPLLAQHGPPNLILAVSDKMKVDKEELGGLPVPVLFFKSALVAGKVEALLEAHSVVGAAESETE